MEDIIKHLIKRHRKPPVVFGWNLQGPFRLHEEVATSVVHFHLVFKTRGFPKDKKKCWKTTYLQKQSFLENHFKSVQSCKVWVHGDPQMVSPKSPAMALHSCSLHSPPHACTWPQGQVLTCKWWGKKPSSNYHPENTFYLFGAPLQCLMTLKRKTWLSMYWLV